MNGRPTIYTQELADTICSRIAEGKSMRSVAEEKEMPSMQTLWRWIRENPQFREQYAQATEERTEAQHELLLDLGDDALNEAKEADPKASNAVVSAVKLKADNLKWVMSKMKPKKYGDKIDHTTAGKELPTPIINVFPNNSDKQGTGNDQASQSGAGGNLSVEDNLDSLVPDRESTD